MTYFSYFRASLILCVLALMAGFVSIVGCSVTQPATSAATAPGSTPTAFSLAPPEKGRAQIWSENCARCHNSRGPDWYSNGEWEVVMMQMRVRGYLNGTEHKAILEFLQAGSK